MKIKKIIRPYYRGADWDEYLKDCPKIFIGDLLDPKKKRNIYSIVLDIRDVMEYRSDCLWVDGKYLLNIKKKLLKENDMTGKSFLSYFFFINDNEYSLSNSDAFKYCSMRMDLCSWFKYSEWVVKHLLE